MDHPFEVGQKCRNRRGAYEVLSIDGPKMRVRYDDGREMNLTIVIQAEIWRNIQLLEETESPKRASGKSKKKARKKPSRSDQQEKLVAEILQDDIVIFEILTRLTIPPGQLNIYRLFVKNPHDYLSQQQIADEIRGSDRQSLASVFRAFGVRISHSPDPRVGSLKPYNSLFFHHKRRAGKTLYRMRQRVVEIFQSYPEFYDFLINDNRSWLPDAWGSEHWTHNQSVHQQQLQDLGLLERYQAQHST